MKTYAHTLKRFEEELADAAARRGELERRVDAKRRELLAAWRETLRTNALADPGRVRELQEMESAFNAYLDEDVIPSIVADATPELDIAPPAPVVHALAFHRRAPVEVRS